MVIENVTEAKGARVQRVQRSLSPVHARMGGSRKGCTHCTLRTPQSASVVSFRIRPFDPFDAFAVLRFAHPESRPLCDFRRTKQDPATTRAQSSLAMTGGYGWRL